MNHYEIDHAMMGSDWQGDDAALQRIAAKLEACEPCTVTAITSSWNGARSINDDGERVEIPEYIWLSVLDADAEENPEH